MCWGGGADGQWWFEVTVGCVTHVLADKTWATEKEAAAATSTGSIRGAAASAAAGVTGSAANGVLQRFSMDDGGMVGSPA